jgi:hypothetical protein
VDVEVRSTGESACDARLGDVFGGWNDDLVRGEPRNARRSGSSVTLTWLGSTRTVDKLTLSADGRTMTGTNNAGWRVQGIKQSVSPACRRPSIAHTSTASARRQAECEYTITWSVALYRKGGGGSVHDAFVAGHGKARGTHLESLNPVDNPLDDDENTITLTKYGRVVLDVDLVRYESPERFKHLIVFVGNVFRSSVKGCPKGTHILVLVSETEAGKKDVETRHCDGVPVGTFEETGKISVAITIKTP